MMAIAAEGQQRATAMSRNLNDDPSQRQRAQQDADYLGGVTAALAWVLGEWAETPVTRKAARLPTTEDLKLVRVHAEELIEQARKPWRTDGLPSPWYRECLKRSIAWLLGDSTVPPADGLGA
jgi:hypothetical protein